MIGGGYIIAIGLNMTQGIGDNRQCMVSETLLRFTIQHETGFFVCSSSSMYKMNVFK